MTTVRAISRDVVAVVAAVTLALVGVTTYAEAAADQSRDKASSARAEADQKCKKGKGKKCKKPAEAGFVPGRVLEIEYTGSALGNMDTPATIYPTGPLFPVNFIPGLGETLATIEIADAVGPNASAGFSWDSDGDGFNDTGFDVCGSTPEPVEVIPGTQYNIFPYLLPSTGCTDAISTTGTITVTFNKV